jgi:hypothetical protein
LTQARPRFSWDAAAKHVVTVSDDMTGQDHRRDTQIAE